MHTFLLVAAFLPLAAALTLSRTYEFGSIPFDSSANLSFTIDVPADKAYLAVHVFESSNVTDGDNWIGIGVSEPTSGSMLGSDIATAQFANGDLDTCDFVDRHVPFAAFPLLSSEGSAPVFPFRDECQDGWTLVRCERDPDAGEMILEVERPLSAEDTQDREIPPGFNNIIYAYGDFFQYHRGRRASTRLVLYEEDGSTDNVGGAVQPLPDDVDGSINITATTFPVSDVKRTVYACTSKRVPLEPGEKKMIVAAEPILNATNENHVHHLTLYQCQNEEYAKLIENTLECTTSEDANINGPLGNQFAACLTFVFGYARGGKRLVLPREAGIVIDEQNAFLVMETHYDNPDMESNAFDNSGVQLYYTNTMRENEAGSILIGDSLVSLIGQRVMSGFEYEFTCPRQCTEKFSEPVNLYATFLHMHQTGMEIVNNKFDGNGTFIENINKVNFWSDSFQTAYQVDPPKKLRPGEQLQLTCKYDTSKRPDTRFGLETTDEMCMDFVGYWPVQRDPITNVPITICSFTASQDRTFTICGGTALNVENPAFEDTVGAPTDFGTEPETCPVPNGEADSSDEPSPGGSVGPGETPVPGGTMAPGETVAATPEDDDGVCFPASAQVTLKNGSVKRMDELAIGDYVQVARGEFSRVFMFTHKTSDVNYEFTVLKTERGISIPLTEGHFIYLNDRLVMAKNAKVGDSVRAGDGTSTRVSEVSRKTERGLYNPQTMHGDIVVNGVVASTYTHVVEPKIAHSLLAPLRWAYWICGVDSSGLII